MTKIYKNTCATGAYIKVKNNVKQFPERKSRICTGYSTSHYNTPQRKQYRDTTCTAAAIPFDNFPLSSYTNCISFAAQKLRLAAVQTPLKTRRRITGELFSSVMRGWLASRRTRG